MAMHPQPSRSHLLASLCALLFLAGSFTIGAADPPPPADAGQEAPLTMQDVGPTPGRPAPVQPLAEPTGQGPQGRQGPQGLYGAFWEENLGQWPEPATWVLRGGATVALGHEGLLVPTPDGPVRLTFVDGHGGTVEIVEPLASTTSVFGAQAVVGARHAERLRMPDVWPGIDFDVYVSTSGSLEYDFRVHPGADPATARLQVEGAVPAIDAGRLVLGPVSFEAPHTFQGDRVIPSHFTLDGQTVSIAVGAYDPQQVLVIDPMLDYGTLLAPEAASPTHRVYAAKETADGLYFAGTLREPYAASWHPLLTQTFDATGYGEHVGFFVHLDPVTKELLHFVQLRTEYQQTCSPSTWCWSGTYAYDLDIDAQGRVYLAGQTGQSGDWGPNFPGIPVVNGEIKRGYGYFAGYVARFEPSGAGYDLQYSTHIGGTYDYSWYDSVSRVVVNPDGSFWVGGTVGGNTAYPSATDTVVHLSAGSWYDNIFAMRFDDAAVPQAELFTTFGGDYYYENVLSDMATDDEGSLYFVGSSAYDPWGWGGLPPLPTTANALQPMKPGNRDHFYGKFAWNGAIEHLSYWGTAGTEEPAASYAGLGGPAITVLGKDEIAIAGTVGTCCLPILSPARLTPGSYGGADGYLSHIHFDQGVIFSTHLGSSGDDRVGALAYDPESEMFFVGGTTDRPIEPAVLFPEVMPRAFHNGRYDAFVTAIHPVRHDPSAAPDSQEAKVAYTMYVGNQVGTNKAGENRVYHLAIGEAGLLVSGNQGGSAALFDAAPTSWNALDNGAAAGLDNTGMFQRYFLKPGVRVHLTDGTATRSTPDDERLETRTLTDVFATATINATILPGVDPAALRWDLDADGVFDDAAGPGAHLVRRDHEELFEVCVEAPLDFPGAPPIEVCIEVFFENRPPVAIVELWSAPAGFLDPLPYFHGGLPVWVDGSSSFDPEGLLDIGAVQWTVESLDTATGTWGPDASFRLGSQGGLTALFVPGDPGQKRITLEIADVLGATRHAALTFHVVVVAEPPEVECLLGGPVRVDRWIDLDVRVTETGATIKNWTLEPGMGLATMDGDGPPPIRIRTAGTLPALGEGTAELVVRDDAGGTASCQVPYVIGPRQVTADFAWSEALAGERVHFTDRSFPDVPQRPVVEWAWAVDGIAMSASANTTHVFAHPGLYQAALTVSDGYHSDTYRVPLEVLPAPSAPVARIGIEPPPYVAGEGIQFTDESVAVDAPIVEWSWQLGGREDARTDPVVALPPGDHVVRLTVHDLDGRVGRDEVTIHVVDNAGVVPEFTASTIEPVVGEAVRFTDVSRIGGAFVEAREWSFADGSRAGQGTAVEHTYWHPGTYDVTLTLFDSEGVRYTVTHAITVVVPGSDVGETPGVRDALLPVADAGVDRRVQAGSVVRVDASESLMPQSTGVVAMWRQKTGPEVELVPDGLAASLRVPYAPGEVIALEVVLEDAAGASLPDVVRLHIVSEHADELGAVPPPDVDFQVERTGTLVRLTAPQHGVDAEYLWDLGDGTTATGRDVVHDYTSHKTYSVQLTVRDVHGQESTATHDVEVRPAGDARGQELDSSRATLYGHDVWTVVLAGLAVATAASVCAFVVRRR